MIVSPQVSPLQHQEQARKPAAKADNATALANTQFVHASGLRNILGELKWDQVHATVTSTTNGDNPRLANLLRQGPVKISFDDGTFYMLVKTSGKIYCLIPSLTNVKPFIGAEVRNLKFDLPGPSDYPRVVS